MNLPLILLGIGATYLVLGRKTTSKIENSQTIDSIDKGFKYNCKTFEITNRDLFVAYYTSIVEMVSSLDEFKNQYNIKFKDFCFECFKRFNKICYDKLIGKSLSISDLRIVGWLFDAFIDYYQKLKYKSLIEMPAKDQPPEELAEYKNYWQTYVNPQRLQILNLLGLTDFDLGIVEHTLETNNRKYP